MTIKQTTMDSPLGPLTILSGDDGLTRIGFGGNAAGDPADPAVRQLTEYFEGTRTRFELPLAPQGTAFQHRVWAALDEIAYGETISYGELTERIGVPRDRIRAVAAAIGANPLLVVRPCHRVVGADGSLTGYAGGLDRKRELLTLEGALQPTLL
ncbi:MAG: methylated-DNA--[protein]-cysteine S-methyltransferase [Hamadaea sp.]|uniref:methylated-DNA--[protein]-cysteine S-methyltransferase n=1 Tax=Hamadaea sp. TaxID=2024425 RepID=UPI001831F16B|nr:methylated-DNA--[protein]-cysteine S-methyltransferase [Hamadaea sp.]NUR70101.1 methylated-DNA--[protein]-cysteine S-methyltransferase [Hamadaea sp.]NUT21447.1 methylated-DNA--[protein]-cysteine S-methyltransferase [Hamadaea sp.]